MMDIKVTLNLFNLDELKKLRDEYYEATVTASSIRLPSHLAIVDVIPTSVRLHIKEPSEIIGAESGRIKD